MNTEASEKATGELIGRLWLHVEPRRRRQLLVLLMLTLCSSFAEVLSIGMVIPFLSALTAPDRLFAHHLMQPFNIVLGLTEPRQLLLPLTLAFGTAVVISGAIRLLLEYTNTRLTFAIGADLSIAVYQRTLYQPFIVHVSRNSSQVISGVWKARELVNSTISPLTTFIASSIILGFIIAALVFVDPLVTIGAIVGLTSGYILIARLNGQRLQANGRIIAEQSVQEIKYLQEGLGGIRDVLIDGTQAIFCEIYRKAILKVQRALAQNALAKRSPRIQMEVFGLILIGLVTYLLVDKSGSIVTALPVLGALALGAQRMLPLLQQAYASWSSILGGQASLEEVLNLLDQPPPPNQHSISVSRAPLPFRNCISIKNLSYRYAEQGPWVLNCINIDIPKGSRIGIVGATGSGKSTLLDLVMGLLLPTKGSIVIDREPLTSDNLRAWQSHIAHVPQSIFLADNTIEENIAFGVPADKIDRERVRQAAAHAQIAETIVSLPRGYDTLIGERGIRLSGGQRQRIGIARALYKQADVIILDEATSALDESTQNRVMVAIQEQSDQITFLVVAHRLSALRNCTQVIELVNGKMHGYGKYDGNATERTYSDALRKN